MAGTQATITRFAIGAMVLVILAGFLTLISMIYALYVRTNEMTGQNVVLPVRTKLLAERGVQYAIKRLREWSLEQPVDWERSDWAAVQYKDRNADGHYHPDTDEVLAYRRDQPLRAMRNPSYSPPDPLSISNEPIRIPDETGDGRPETVGFSLRVPSPVDDVTDLVSLKVLDCASMIYVNGPIAEPGDWTLAPNVVRLLDNLGATDEVGVPQLGMILNEWRRRHKRAYATRRDVARALAMAKVPERKWAAVLNNVTCHAWVDERVLNPGALVSAVPPGEDVSPGGKYRWARSRRPGAPLPAGRWAGCHLDWLLGEAAEESLPGPLPIAPPPGPPRLGAAPLLQPRAPINVNTASLEVLVAVLARLEASVLDRAERDARPLPGAPGRSRRSPDAVVTPGVARIVAEWIVSHRATRPFRTWNQFERFLLGLPDDDVSPLRKRVILAAVNPNSRLASFNPDCVLGLRHGDVDKAALGDWSRGAWRSQENLPFCGWTTEFCFSSMGYYQIECLVRLLDPPVDGIHPVAAETQLETAVQIYDVVRLTTQKDFLTHTESTTTVAGDLPAVRSWPDSMEDLLGLQGQGPDGIAETCLRRAERATADQPACSHALCWDGHLSLAPLDGDSPLPAVLRARFTSSLDAISGGRTVPARGSADAHRSLIDAVDPSELFPDGVFCHETRRASFTATSDRYGGALPTLDEHVAWAAPGQWPDEGTLEFWVKPTWNGDELYDASKPGPCRHAEAADTRTFVSLGRGRGKDGEPGAGDRLIVFARRGLLAATWGNARAETPGPDDPAPPTLFHAPEHAWCSELRAVATPILDWKAGEWHHVRVSWRGSDLTLETDGRRAMGPPVRSAARPFAAGIPDGWLLFLGHNRFRDGRCNDHPLTADATFDGVTLLSRSAHGLPLPDRYPGGPRPHGIHLRLVAGVDFPHDSEDTVLGTLTWNGRTTGSGGAVVLAAGPMPADLATLRPAEGADPASDAQVLATRIPAGADVFLSCAFYAADPGPAGFVAESPVLEDVTLTVLRTPRMHSWWMR